MKITEVYFRSSEKKPGQQWFEVFNDAQVPVNLRSAFVRRLDGQKKQQVWAVFLPDEDLILEPDQFALIAQKPDLGQNLCSKYKVIALKDANFAFKYSGIQTLCITAVGQPETCVKISDSKKVDEGLSRVPLAGLWINEPCEVKPGFLASPGSPMGFCQKNMESGWTQCPEIVASPEAVVVKSAVRQTVRQASSGCQMTQGSPDKGLELIGLLLVLFVGLAQVLKPLCGLRKLYTAVLDLVASRFAK